MTTLLQRQADVLDHLTSAAVIYGEQSHRDGAPAGLDRAMLRLEAVFSHEKRMEKVTAVYPRTLELLGVNQDAIIREFTSVCPPSGISRLDNAAQFFEFLVARWEREPPEPAWLRDVAACEYACAQARVGDDGPAPASASDADHSPAIRRHPRAVLQRCRHDIRPLFEGGGAVQSRETHLAVVIPSGADHPQILELTAPVFALVEALPGWTNRRAFAAAPELDALLSELARLGVVEARP